MLTFHDDPQLKSDLLRELAWHRDQDKLIKGTYGEEFSNGEFKGCAVGCSIHSYNRLKNEKIATGDYSAYETCFGIPSWLAYLEDLLFEGLPQELAMQWPQRFSEAIPVGVSGDTLSRKVLDPFLIFTMRDCWPNARPDGQSAIDMTIGLCERRSNGDDPSESAWSAAEAAGSAAGSAAWSAAWAARSAAGSAAWAARSAAMSAAEAAGSAAGSAAWSAAWSAAYVRFADELVRLLSELERTERP